MPPLVTGFVFDGPRSPSPAASGASYALDFPTGAGSPGATIGSPCATGDDCAALGEHAACFRNDTGGFCTIDCDLDPEGPSVLCPAESFCFAGLRTDGGRLCLRACDADGDCASGVAGAQCSGSLFSFNVADGYRNVCLPSCSTNADCNADVSGLVCDVTRHRCASPREVLGSACAANADCLGLGPGGTCLRSARDGASSYCTVACDPAASDACRLSGVDDTLGPCVSGYASAPDGADVAVCLGGCSSNAECQGASSNTCNFLPSFGASVCTIACRSDADCIDGACNLATGDCQQAVFFSPNCASDSNCPGGLCVADFHHRESRECSLRCARDAECPSGAVCVTSNVAIDPAGTPLAPGTGDHSYVAAPGDIGFCAPSCTLDPGTCSSPDTTCLAPMDRPEIDFSGSGSASSAFCWR